jgi:DNA repair protein RadD
MTGLHPLRPHQITGMDMLRQSLAGGKRRPMLQLPTGAGKTVVAAHIVDGAHRKLNRVTFCVPSISLVDQTFERFVENGIDAADMGVIQGSHPWYRPHCPIQIASVQTLARRQLPITDLVIVDEAHMRFAVLDSWMANNPDLRFIGLSATPWSRGLGKQYDDLIKPTSMRNLISAGHLSDFKVYAPSHPDLSGVKTRQTAHGTDYNEADLAERMNTPELVADVVSTWLQLGNNEPTLCFATGRAHAKALHDRFEEAGVPVAYVDAYTEREDRELIGKQLAAGTVKVVCNIGCLTTGVDWDVRCLILARPTKSEILFTQIIGRALRPAEAKSHAVILDHSDTHLRLGMVTDIDHDDLDDGRPRVKGKKAEEKDLPLPKECLVCNGLVPARADECPCCGAARPGPVFVEAEGELVEMGGNCKPAPKAPKKPKVSEQLAAMGKPKIYAQIKAFQRERDRSDGWGAHLYREIFGVWPRGMDETKTEPPCPMLRSFVRSRDIAWANSQKQAKATDFGGGIHA